MRRLIVAAAVAVAGASTPALTHAGAPPAGTASPGMWMPHQVPMLDLRRQGLKIDPEVVYRNDGTGLMSAVVTFDDGGTGEFVSADGLVLTNHHIVSNSLQRESTTANDYLAAGYVAASREREMPARGMAIDVLLGYRDVTSEYVAARDPTLPPQQRREAIEAVGQRLVAAAESAAPDLHASVAATYAGTSYYLYTYKRIRDVRIAYAPPLTLGRFGGDIDNWMWPRHASDFAFIRAYVAPDGRGAAYDGRNVPYRPRSFLRIARDGVSDGQFAFVMGYPGVTHRTRTLSELQFDLRRIARRGEFFEDSAAFLRAAGRADDETRLRYATTVRSLGNVAKNVGAKLEGVAKYGVVEKKRADEQSLAAWVQGAEDRRRAYGSVIAEMDAFMARFEAHSIRAYALQDLVEPLATTTLLGQAHAIYRAAVERRKPDADRDPAYQDRARAALRERVASAEREYSLATDRAFLEHRLAQLSRRAAEESPTALRPLLSRRSEAEIAAYVAGLYARTRMADPAQRLAYLEMGPAALLATGDPLIRLAADIDPELAASQAEGRVLDQERLDRNGPYVQALLAQRGGRVAADANSTLRFSYGKVEGYSPADAVTYTSQTTLGGLLRKKRDAAPFEVPAKLEALHRARDFGRWGDRKLGDVPVCFLTSALITGGNSGSPTLNAKGELVGIVFDMTYESVTADYFVIPELTRTVSVDIRNVLFLTEKFAGATWIVAELGL